MVASTHWLASAAGMAMLERGGNAFDAATAAGLALQVVEPHLNGPGGDATILTYHAESRRVILVDGQGPAPAAATIDRFRALDVDLVPGTGLLPACIPGAFGAWMHMFLEFGTLSLREVFEHALAFATDGYVVLPGMAAAISSVERVFRDHWAESAAVYLDGGIPAAGSIFRNTALAHCYRQLLDDAESAGRGRDRQIEAARRAFYEGFVAETIDRWLDGDTFVDAEGREHPALLDGEDMATWRAGIEEPVSIAYRDHDVYKAGPWTQGPVFLQQLRLLEGFDLEGMHHGSAEYIHTVTECAKLAFADREAWYGDPRFFDVPMRELLAGAYADERRHLVDDLASGDLRSGAPAGRPPRLPTSTGAAVMPAGVGEPVTSMPGDTCHVDVVDRHGNMVAATPSGGWLQSSSCVPGLGFPLGTRAQMFWLEDGLPNSLAPKKRPRTTLSPTIVLRDGEPCLAFGTPGGDQQDQWSLNFFLAHVHFALNLQEAIDAPMFHNEHFPGSFYPRIAKPRELVLESRFEPAVIRDLEKRGHSVRVEGEWSLGRVSAVGRDLDSGLLKAGANPRGMQGYAVGR